MGWLLRTHDVCADLTTESISKCGQALARRPSDDPYSVSAGSIPERLRAAAPGAYAVVPADALWWATEGAFLDALGREAGTYVPFFFKRR